MPASGGSGSPYKVVPSHSNDDNAANDRTERHLPITNRQQATESHMQQQQQSLVSSASAASPSAQQQQQMRVAIPRSRSSQQHLNDARPLSQQFPSNGHLHHQQQQQQQQYVYGGGGNGRPSSVYGAYGVPVQMRTQQQQHQQQRPPSVHGLLPASVTVPGSLQQQQRLTSASSQPTYDTHVSWRLSLSQSALQQGQGQGSSSGHVMPMHSQNSISANHDSASNDGQQQQQQQQRARKIIYEVVV